MADMQDFDLEIQNEKDSTPEQFTTTVTTAGTPVTVTPSSGKAIQLTFIKNPNKGPNANSPNDVILITLDGGSQTVSLSRGEYIYIPGIYNNFDVDATVNGTAAEIIVWT